MIFSSIPAYLDPANYWQQSPPGPTGNSSTNPQVPPPPPQPHVGGTGGTCSIRPGSMSDRARMANIPIPEAALKCPRCESTNTKFCYFNNYNLTQPRHFCKNCRRYWTRGGALRNVPVGGGYRRNKRSKPSRSKSPMSSDYQTTSGSTTIVSSNSGQANLLGLMDYGALSESMVLTNDMNFQMGTNFLGGGGGVTSFLSSGRGIEQLRMQQTQQYPFLGRFHESPMVSPGIYTSQGGVQTPGFGGETGHVRRPEFSSSMVTPLASVNMEDNQEQNYSRQTLGIPGNDQWGTGKWTDFKFN